MRKIDKKYIEQLKEENDAFEKVLEKALMERRERMFGTKDSLSRKLNGAEYSSDTKQSIKDRAQMTRKEHTEKIYKEISDLVENDKRQIKYMSIVLAFLAISLIVMFIKKYNLL